jgi:hypothetical protein
MSLIKCRLFACLFATMMLGAAAANPATQPTTDDGTRYMLTREQLAAGAHHTRHDELYSRGVDGLNRFVLRGVDKAQASAPEGGGYFIGIKATPTESPIGYPLALFGQKLLDPPRKTSYCSGSSYTAFIEALNLIFLDRSTRPSSARLEAARMQEPAGGRREDGIKLWGHWNDDGPGSQFALVQYTQMGVEIAPKNARPGDFMNISWTNGGGHSVVFLGWHADDAGKKHIRYWASQPGTNGLGDQSSPLEKVRAVKAVRLVSPEKLFTFDPATSVNDKVKYDVVDW